MPLLTLKQRGRRRTLRRLAACFTGGAVGWLTLGHANEQRVAVCANPDALGPDERRQRTLDNYTERSPDPDATCSACALFIAGGDAASCGTCQLFRGPANPKGRCDDWTRRAT